MCSIGVSEKQTARPVTLPGTAGQAKINVSTETNLEKPARIDDELNNPPSRRQWHPNRKGR
eukprot:3320732-Prorocentrum_lima.AAC.1